MSFKVIHEIALKISATVATAVAVFLSSAPAVADDDLAAAMKIVEQTRGLRFKQPVVRKTLKRTDLRSYLTRQIERGLPVSPSDYANALVALQLVDQSEKDPIGKLLTLYEAQVLAFYDPDTDIYYDVTPRPPSLESAASSIELHELTHALQDQQFDAGDRLNALQDDWDAQVAYQSVIEGEAMLVMIASLLESAGQSLTDVVQNEELVASLSSLSTQTGIPEGTPPYFVESATFPYIAGLNLVIAAYRNGGWTAVDALHRKPPRSTEEVMHPELYFQRSNTPAASLAVAPANAGRIIVSGALGEFGWKFLLGEKAARGWAADSVTVVEKNNALTVLVDSRWDSVEDAGEFAAAARAFYKRRGIDAVLRVATDSVRIAYGADRAAIAAYAGPARELRKAK